MRCLWRHWSWEETCSDCEEGRKEGGREGGREGGWMYID